MKRLLIIAEGRSEEKFVNSVLKSNIFDKRNIDVSCHKIKTTNGGLVKYEHLKFDLIGRIYENNQIVTTLIDYYALPTDFPKFEESKSIVNKNDRLNFLENSIIEDIQITQKANFRNLLPYIQIHEFEALLFSSDNGLIELKKVIENKIDIQKFYEVTNRFPNPEDINENKLSAPSKRMKEIISGYNKVNHSILLIEKTGIETILNKCPRFRTWVEKMIEEYTK